MSTFHTFFRLLILTLHLHAIPPATGAAARHDADTLMPGQAFTVGNKLVSGNGKFALGFFQPRAAGNMNQPSSSTSPGWYLGIWFHKIPLVTPVWVANRETPILEPYLNATQLQISGDGNLLVIVSNTTTTTTTPSVVIWSTSTHTAKSNNTAPTTTTCRAILKNTGNLVIESLEDPSSSNATTATTMPWLWQSFDNPTNALLPHAKIGWNKATGLNRVGISWKSQVDPGLGSFRVGLDTNAGATPGNNVTIRRWIYPNKTYWRWSPGAAGGMKIPELRALLHMNPQTSGLVVPEYVNNGEEEYYMYTSPDESSSTFFSIETNGQVKMNAWSHANQSWYSIFVQPVDPCSPYATCGPFTVCTGTSHPPCECLETFSPTSPQDWDLGDRTGGCSRNTLLDCSADTAGTSSADVFHPIARVTLPYGPQSSLHAMTRSECQRACLSNCSCTAYSYQDTRCSVWHGKLFNVNKDDGIEISSEDSIYIRLAAGDFPGLTPGTTRKTLPVGVITAASVIGSGVLLLIAIVISRRKRFKYYWCGDSSPAPSSQASVGVVVFSYADLGRATRNFSEKLGAGGFGSVYKGVISGMSAVAVKRLDGVRQGEKQFRAEVSALGLIQHINLVKLVGFCCQGDKRLLVYEHMCNGSLDNHLFRRNDDVAVLDWSTRYQIAIGAARGLSYLHQSCRECIIHCDIKPENILLDASFVPKIADFGLASVIGRDFSRVLTTFKGTMGYLAPEWLSGVPITSKVDVYSFGMVLMEIISGTRNASVVYNRDHVAYFPVHAMSQLHEGDVQSLVDPNLHENFSLDEVERVCKVACWCIQDNESDRPTMGEVVRVLEGLQDLDIPPIPRLLAAITECSSVATM